MCSPCCSFFPQVVNSFFHSFLKKSQSEFHFLQCPQLQVPQQLPLLSGACGRCGVTSHRETQEGRGCTLLRHPKPHHHRLPTARNNRRRGLTASVASGFSIPSRGFGAFTTASCRHPACPWAPTSFCSATTSHRCGSMKPIDEVESGCSRCRRNKVRTLTRCGWTCALLQSVNSFRERKKSSAALSPRKGKA